MAIAVYCSVGALPLNYKLDILNPQMIDTHCHIDDPQYAEDLSAFLEDQKTSGVEAILVPGVEASTTQDVLDVCAKYPGYLYPALGLHPENVKEDWREQLATIKAAVDNNYRVTAWLLEDGIEAEQDGATAEWMHTHENALRPFSGTSLNMGVYGERLGDLKAGQTAEKVLTIAVEEGWKAENYKVLVIANASVEGRYDLANCIICPIGGTVSYDYK